MTEAVLILTNNGYDEFAEAERRLSRLGSFLSL